MEEEHDARIETLLATGDPTVRRMVASHTDNQETVAEVRAALEELGVQATFGENPHAPDSDDAYDLVITVGGDGTLLAASHHVGAHTPILGVNSAPNHSVGFFCAADKGKVKETLDQAIKGTLRRVSLTRMRVDLNDICLDKRVLNEALFCHSSPAATSRYILRPVRADGTFSEEEQKSSGIWVGPAAGSTAAQKSAGGRVLPLSSTKLQYVVREPYTPDGGNLELTNGLIDEGGYLFVRCKMKSAKLFLDGEHTVYDVTIGDVLRMRRLEEPLTVLGLKRNGNGKG